MMKPEKRLTKTASVVQAISNKIEHGRLKGGDRLSSEEQLAADYKVSLGTVQKALAELARQGLINREHGRGTFVTTAARTPSELRYLRFRGPTGEDLPLYIYSHKMKTTRSRGPWSEFLGNSHLFIRIQRTINVGGEFEIFSEFVLRSDEFEVTRDLNLKALEQRSLRDTLRQQFALPTLRIEQHMAFAPLSERIAHIVGQEPASTGLVMELFGYTTNDRPFCYQRVYSGLFAARLIVSR